MEIMGVFIYFENRIVKNSNYFILRLLNGSVGYYSIYVSTGVLFSAEVNLSKNPDYAGLSPVFLSSKDFLTYLSQ